MVCFWDLGVRFGYSKWAVSIGCRLPKFLWMWFVWWKNHLLIIVFLQANGNFGSLYHSSDVVIELSD